MQLYRRSTGLPPVPPVISGMIQLSRKRLVDLRHEPFHLFFLWYRDEIYVALRWRAISPSARALLSTLNFDLSLRHRSLDRVTQIRGQKRRESGGVGLGGVFRIACNGPTVLIVMEIYARAQCRAGQRARSHGVRATDNNNCFDSHGNWIAAAGIIKGLFTVVVTTRRYYKFNLSLIGRRVPPRPGPVSRNVPPIVPDASLWLHPGGGE